jgi:hypothetical protein
MLRMASGLGVVGFLFFVGAFAVPIGVLLARAGFIEPIDLIVLAVYWAGSLFVSAIAHACAVMLIWAVKVAERLGIT